MRTILLYTKKDCGLCEEVKRDLASFQPRFPHRLEEVDITLEKAIFEAYKHSIPVVKIGNILLQAPITKADLETALQNIH